MNTRLLFTLSAFALLACGGGNSTPAAAQGEAEASAPAAAERPFQVTEVAKFEEPWAMTFLPDGRLLVTEKKGKLKLVDLKSGKIGEIAGVPTVDYGGQGGFGDVVLHPDFASNNIVYLSWVEAGKDDTRGAAVGRGKLVLDDKGGGRIEGLKVIWRQDPKVTGRGHFSHRIAFSPDGFMFISSGERQKFDPAQDMKMNLGKIVRLTDTGGVPSDNPYYEKGPVTSQIWTLGHRNVLGLAFDAQNRLWDVEMGPKGGDELNLVVKGDNYGYPIVSNGDHYDGRPIPDHNTRPEFNAPKVSWTPVISPSSLIFYSGDKFPDWKGDALIGGLSSKALIRVEIEGDKAHEAARYGMGERIRGVEQGPDGAIWLLEDEDEGSGGRLLKLTPAG